MRGDAEMANLPPEIPFQEDQQTYYGAGWAGQTVLFQRVQHHGPRRPYEERPPETWDAMDKRSESYRLCCTAQVWIGTALAARLVGAQRTWGHDAFFDYCDRWMQQDDFHAAARGKHKRPVQEGGTYDPLVSNMYFAQRDRVPKQSGAEKNFKWVWTEDAAGKRWGAVGRELARFHSTDGSRSPAGDRHSRLHRRAARSHSALWRARRPVPSKIWRRQLVPSAHKSAFGCRRIAGKSSVSPTCMERA